MKNCFKHNSDLRDLLLIFSKENVPQAVIVKSGSEKDASGIAEYLAQYILCQNRKDLAPCLECTSCKKIKENNHPDVIYPERSGVLNTYSIDTIRKVKLDTSILPNEAKFKIYIFFNAELIGHFAQNALLKILEEPPRHIIFLFFCNKLSTILSTVRSRCQVFCINEMSETKARTLSRNLTDELVEILVYKTEYEALSWSSKLRNNKELLRDIVLDLALILKSALYFKFTLSEDRDLDFKYCESLLRKFSVENLLYFVDVLNDIYYMMMSNVNFSLLVTYFLSSLFNY